jgi:TetR/AcrR family transcriptional regulator, transcriptional repressor for nem operon
LSESKEHIIKVASQLFMQKSFKEVTMKEIVVKTGLSKGAFYHYFESKEQLFLAVLDYFFTDVAIHAYERYSKDSFYKFYHEYANEVKAYSEKYLATLSEDENDVIFTMNYFTLAFDALKLFPEFREMMVVGQKKEIKVWVDVIKNARKNGEIISTMNDELIAQTFIYLGDGVAMHMIMEGVKIDEMIKAFLLLWDNLYTQIKA